jgi:replicative DNA helicase
LTYDTNDEKNNELNSNIIGDITGNNYNSSNDLTDDTTLNSSVEPENNSIQSENATVQNVPESDANSNIASNSEDSVEEFVPGEENFVNSFDVAMNDYTKQAPSFRVKSKKMQQLMEEEGLTEEEFNKKYYGPDEAEKPKDDIDQFDLEYVNYGTEEGEVSLLEQEEARLKKEKYEDLKAAQEREQKAIQDRKKAEARREQEEQRRQEQEERERMNSDMSDSGEYPNDLSDIQLEYIYIGILLNNPKAISRFYFLYDECLFSNEGLGNLYKIILFQDGEEFAPQVAKDKFKFPKEDIGTYDFKMQVKNAVGERNFNIEFIYTKLKKLFLLKKFYKVAPTSHIQDKIVEVVHYERYEEMTIEEVENAIEQIGVTNRLSQVILNENATEFLLAGESTLTGGCTIPFPIINTAFKGLRRGETFVYAMPSNYGKSRFTTYIAAYLALVEKRKVLIISNEMSEEKIRLCFYTTVINSPDIQKLHGHKLHKKENELLDLQFRADEGAQDVELDENGFILKREGESRKDFIKRISKVSTEFTEVIQVMEWLKEQVKINNCIHFCHITDNNDDEVRKIVMNYFYHYNIEYTFYDTLKTDAEHIGDSDALKKTATILSNIAQKYHMFIAGSMQLLESSTLPVNLTINEMSHSKTVKEVLDTLCLFKQINPHTYQKYEYSEIEVSDDYRDIEATKDPDERFYCCVVDKNRAGPKPTLLFRLNLAYNYWEELGYVKLKDEFLEL